MTTAGAILGTPQYMAPEQIDGREADARTDIFAFAAIVYEMATGRRAFEGTTPAAVMGAILEREPTPLSSLQPAAPPLLDSMVMRCLAKDPEERWQSASDVLHALRWMAEPGAAASHPAGRTLVGRRGERTLWAAALAVTALLGVWGRLAAPSPPSLPPDVRLDIASPPTTDPWSLAVSPDGRRVAFNALADGTPMLWLRSLDSAASEPLKGTEGAGMPFWSPDGKSIGFGASGQLKRIDLASGAVRKLASTPLFLGGTWTRDGSILFVRTTYAPVYRIPADGGRPVPVTATKAPHTQYHPLALPDGEHFLYNVAGPPDVRGVYVAKLDGTASRRVVETSSPVVVTASGHLLYAREGTLAAQRFDPATLTVQGDAIPVVEHVASTIFSGAVLVAVSASPAGPVVYRSDPGHTLSPRLSWVDRSGREVGKPFDLSGGTFNVALSPDEERVALFRAMDIWLFEFASRTLNRLTSDPALDLAAVWSPDGNSLAFCSNRKGAFDLYRKAATGAGGEELLLATDQDKAPTDWSPDGEYLLYRSLDPDESFDVWGLHLRDGKPFPLVKTPHDERDAQFSPNGRWIAYQSSETGRFEIWVRPFAPPGSRAGADDKWQFSLGGGTGVRWGRDGKELFYQAPNGSLMAVPVRLDGAGRSVSPGPAQALFHWGDPQPFDGGPALPWYSPSRDARRFLMTTVPLKATTTPITVDLNRTIKP